MHGNRFHFLCNDSSQHTVKAWLCDFTEAAMSNVFVHGGYFDFSLFFSFYYFSTYTLKILKDCCLHRFSFTLNLSVFLIDSQRVAKLHWATIMWTHSSCTNNIMCDCTRDTFLLDDSSTTGARRKMDYPLWGPFPNLKTAKSTFHFHVVETTL